MNLTVNEIFYSLQGEGGRAGQASIFIRLAKCNLNCSFCDTEFEQGIKMSPEEVLSTIGKYGCRWIIWTGGEPTLQLTDDVVAFFKEKGYLQAIETNGTKKRCLPGSIIFHAAQNKISRKSEILFPRLMNCVSPSKRGGSITRYIYSSQDR